MRRGTTCRTTGCKLSSAQTRNVPGSSAGGTQAKVDALWRRVVVFSEATTRAGSFTHPSTEASAAVVALFRKLIARLVPENKSTARIAPVTTPTGLCDGTDTPAWAGA